MDQTRKPAGISLFIGKRPSAAFGSSAWDRGMLHGSAMARG